VESSRVVSPGEIYWGEDTNAKGSEQKGHRLWLVMSRRILNGNNTIVVVPLTTSRLEKATKHPDFCIRLPAGEIIVNLGASPSKDCVALCHQVRVIDKSRLDQQYGKLSSAIPAVQLGLSFVFNL